MYLSALKANSAQKFWIKIDVKTSCVLEKYGLTCQTPLCYTQFLDVKQISFGAVHKWCLVTHLGGGGSAKIWYYSISVFSKMGNEGDGGVINLKKWVALFMDGPFTPGRYINCIQISKSI